MITALNYTNATQTRTIRNTTIDEELDPHPPIARQGGASAESSDPPISYSPWTSHQKRTIQSALEYALEQLSSPVDDTTPITEALKILRSIEPIPESLNEPE